MQNERRMNRSNVPGIALTLALAAAARRSGARAAVLADEQGLLVAGAGAGFNLDHVAAFAPLAPERRGNFSDVMRGETFTSAPIRVNGTRLFFAAVGGPLGDIGRLEAAADRILS
jgi:hypothetical protein